MTTEEKPRPKPAPPKAPNKPVATPTQEATNEKPKFVRKPHLTEKPFRAHEGLQNLKKQMDASKKQPKKPAHRGQNFKGGTSSRTNKEKK